PIGWTVQSYLQAREMPRAILLLEAFKVVVLLVSIVTFGRVSPLATCAAVGFAFTTHALLALWVVRQVDGVPFGRTLGGLGAALGACVPMTAAVLAVRHGLAGAGALHPIAGLVAEVIAGAAGYALGALV